MIDSKTKYPDDIIREFTLEILSLKERVIELQKKISEKEYFLKVIKQKQTVKYSELYTALENETTTYWRIKEVKVESRTISFYEIKVFKKYFFTTNQLEIIRKHFMKQFTRSEHDIRISQFY